MNSEKLRDEGLKEIRIKMNALKNRAVKAIEDLTPFSFKKFEEAFYEASNLEFQTPLQARLKYFVGGLRLFHFVKSIELVKSHYSLN